MLEAAEGFLLKEIIVNSPFSIVLRARARLYAPETQVSVAEKCTKVFHMWPPVLEFFPKSALSALKSLTGRVFCTYNL
jgi:hypothetical protein